MGRFDSLYARMPVWAQHAAVSVYGGYWHWLRFGPGYARYIEEYRSRDRFSADQWQVWQRARLREVLRIAVSHVPYYQQHWSAGTHAAAAEGRLEELPLLEKDAVRADPRAFLRQDLGTARRFTFYTSGSSGTPIASVWTVGEIRQSLALREVRSAGWAGVSFKQPRATFAGRIIEPDPDSRGPFYRYNAVEGQVYLSTFHVRADTARLYVQALTKHRVQWLTGYAHAFYALATFIVEQRLTVPPLKALVTTSEKVTPEMRRTMRQAYGCPVFEEYSTVESAVFASECASGKLHVSPDAGVIEILRPDGSACAAGETGEVIATPFIREGQPFVRFRMGDLAMWDGEPCSCGRAMPVIKEVVGRMDDVVVAPDGRQLTRFNGVFADDLPIREAQVVQEALTRLRVKIVPAPGFSASDADEIIRRIQVRLGQQVEVLVEPVSAIPRTAAGKFRAVVSQLKAARPA